MTRDLDTTLGSTIPDTPTGERPTLTTFERPEERFELGAELGRGGMGRVIAATDVSLARQVAIKQVLSDRPDDLVRFEREVRITAQLEHPSIVPIHEAALDANGRPYYVMRRIEGDPLSVRLTDVNLRTRLALLPNLLAVVDAAAFAHARKIIHRDIKPSNILLGAYGETHLIDWGLARRLDDLDLGAERLSYGGGAQLTQAGHIYGTVGYMAPEQARGESVDERADVYALGATLFHVVAGFAPFAHLSDVQRLAAAVTGDDRPPFEKLGDEVPPELIAIIDKAMAEDRGVRYRHAGELAADLRAFLGGKLVAAHRYTASERLRRFVRTHRTTMAVAMGFIVLGIIGSVYAVSRVIDQKVEAEKAEVRADHARQRAEDEAETTRNREQELWITRASALAPRDPTRAAAMLLKLQLPMSATHAQQARDTIARVAAAGISRGTRVHTKQINGLAFSPDGKQLASTSGDGLVVLYDVATAGGEVIVDLQVALYRVLWLDDHTLLVIGDQLTRLVDVPTRRARAFHVDLHAVRFWRTGDRIRYFSAARHTIEEVALTAGPPRELARDVTDAHGADHVAIFTTATGTFVLDDERIQRVGEPLLKSGAMEISHDRKRVALATTTMTFEWEIATGKQRSWNTGAISLHYARSRLLAYNGGALLHLLRNGRWDSRSIEGLPMWQTQIASGTVIGLTEGGLVVSDRAGLHILQHHAPGARALASLPSSMTVAIGSKDGSVRWIDLSRVAPIPVPIPPGMVPCALTGSHLYGVHGDTLYEIDLATSATRTVASSPVNLGLHCVAKLGNHLLGHSPIGVANIDITTGAVTIIPGATHPVAGDGDAAYAKDRTVYLVRPGEADDQALYTAATTVRALLLRPDILGVVLDDRILRIERATGKLTSTPARNVTTLGFYRAEAFWFATGRDLRVWSSDTVSTLGTLPTTISDAAWTADRMFATLADGSLWEIENGKPVERVSAGIRENFAMSRHRAISTNNRDLRIHFLGSGEEIVYDLQVNPPSLLLSDGNFVSHTIDAAVVYREVVPANFSEAWQWLSRTTNARIAPSGALEWK